MENQSTNELDKKKKDSQQDKNVEFTGEDERVDSSNPVHSESQVGGAGGNNFDSGNEVNTHQ